VKRQADPLIVRPGVTGRPVVTGHSAAPTRALRAALSSGAEPATGRAADQQNRAPLEVELEIGARARRAGRRIAASLAAARSGLAAGQAVVLPVVRVAGPAVVQVQAPNATLAANQSRHASKQPGRSQRWAFKSAHGPTADSMTRSACSPTVTGASSSLTGEEMAAAQSALRYFRTGGARHSRDEEESLFPRLRADSAGDSLARLEALEDDHHEAADLHEIVEELYSAWMANGRLDREQDRRLRASADRLTALYQAHIEVEESVVFPRAAELLDRATIAAMGEEFRARRA
jgi:hemerythrin superfamily protein